MSIIFCAVTAKIPTIGVGLGSPNRNIFLYCSKVKNFVALLGVSAIIGGNIPL